MARRCSSSCTNALSPLLDEGYLEGVLRRQYQPLLESEFDEVLHRGRVPASNFGAREQLTVLGVPVARHITRDKLRYREQGSVIAIVATDAPLMPHQLKRIARRVPLGLARTGTVAHNGPGDIFLAFSTANPGAWSDDPPVKSLQMLSNAGISALFYATVQASNWARQDIPALELFYAREVGRQVAAKLAGDIITGNGTGTVLGYAATTPSAVNDDGTNVSPDALRAQNAVQFVAWLAAAGAYGQTFADRPLRVVVPFAPGGSTDVLARIVGQRLAETMGQPAIVDNRPAAGGTVATDLVAKAPPDGHTLFIGSIATMVIAEAMYSKLPYDPLRDFAHVNLWVTFRLALVLPASTPYTTTQDLIAAARAKPGTLRFGAQGIGTSSHVFAELMNSMARMKIIVVASEPASGGG